ncbi:hypothetical protein JTB14_017298 [Gonioctena quinquepunctata]|nr:hypothetical protein JTB14_017298 [Gonioctena quinquepunctata]
MSSSNSLKSRKNSKDREKRKSQTGPIEISSNDKGSPSKDTKQYAGISSESICLYADQSSYEHLSEEICNTLAEDINYKLRYIIHEALLKARFSSRDVIVSRDIEETFKNLSIEKVYGAPSNHNWVHSGDVGEQSFLYLNDTEINLIELAEAENTYAQHGNVKLSKRWFTDPDTVEPSQALKNYFTTVCQTVISNDEELRRMALKDISENPNIGPIMEWFYHFGYFLLMKDITYDCLTLCALDLIETLENSPLGSVTVSNKQLKLLVRLLLQRLLLSPTSKNILKNMCSTLAVLCLRKPLRDMAIAKINQKLGELSQDKVLPVLAMTYFLGVEAVEKIFVPNINYFFNILRKEEDPELINMTQAIYGLLCKMDFSHTQIHKCFQEEFGNRLVMYWKPIYFKISSDPDKLEVDFVAMKTQLFKTRRKVDYVITSVLVKPLLEDVFDLPEADCKVKRKIDEHRMGLRDLKKETHIIVGKTCLLLSVLNEGKYKTLPKCTDHSLLRYNL